MTTTTVESQFVLRNVNFAAYFFIYNDRFFFFYRVLMRFFRFDDFLLIDSLKPYIKNLTLGTTRKVAYNNRRIAYLLGYS
jgi:hypothetical protein